ncbi:MAG: PQQ-binding-like beta-propeller repeat protein [Gemmataceae bacterium]
MTVLLLHSAILVAQEPAAPPPFREPLNGASLPDQWQAQARLVANRLDNAQQLAEQGQWAEAIQEYQNLVDQSGSALARTGDGHYLSVRRLCQQRLAALPPEALALYRQRVDEQARPLFDEATRQRDHAALRRLVERFFCSRPAEAALDLLGDLAFERGEFTEAERWWRYLARPASEAVQEPDQPAPASGRDLLYPDPRRAPALPRAKQILALLFRGETPRAAIELAAFRRLHAAAQGHLVGQTGNLAAILQALLDQRTQGKSPSAPLTDWPTFAGDASRSWIIEAAPNLAGFDPFPRHVRLDGHMERFAEVLIKVDDPPRRVEPEPSYLEAARALAYHPVVSQGKVVFADALQVVAYDLHTGQRTMVFDMSADYRGPKLDVSTPVRSDIRYTLTVADQRVYARLGAQVIADQREVGSSFLVCLDLAAAAPLRWQVPARTQADEPPFIFEGAPLVEQGRLYVAVTHFLDTGAAVTAIDCLDADTGRRLWRQDVCQEPAWPAQESPQRRHQLLTLAGPLVVYGSHSGMVAAVDRHDGQPAWTFRYPSRGARTDNALPSPRDLAPCIHAEGRLFVAPADSDRIFCLDGDTGRLQWESKPVEVAQLLGVARGRLVFTTDSKPRGIRAVAAASGAEDIGWLQPEDGGDLPTLGRGFLAGDWVFWPTVKGLRVVRIDDGQPIDIDFTQLRHFRSGNLIYADGYLISAGASDLYIYSPAARLLEERRRDAQLEPRSAWNQYRLGLARASAGEHDPALSAWAECIRLAANDSGNDVGLSSMAQRQRHDWFLQWAARERAEKQWGAAAALLERAAAAELPSTPRLQALRQLAELWQEAGRPARAEDVARRILADETLRQGWMFDDDRMRPAAQWAHRLLHPHAGTVNPSPLNPLDPLSVTAAPSATSPSTAWRLPLRRGWQQALAESRPAWHLSVTTTSPLDAFLCVQGEELICRAVDTGRERWRQSLRHAVSWAGSQGDMLVVAGAEAMRCLHWRDGRELWKMELSDLLPFAIERMAGEEFGHFQLTAAGVVCMHGNRRLLVVNPRTGAGRAFWAPAARVGPLPPGGHWHESYALPSGALVAQTGLGQRWTLDVEKGALPWRESSSSWLGPPVAVADRYCVVTERQRIVGFPGATAVEPWAYQVPGPASLTGAPPRLLAHADKLVLLASRNYGGELRRLDAATGQLLWPDAVFAGSRPIDAARAALDDQAVYLVAGDRLTAYALDSGERLWTAPLAGWGSQWRVTLLGDYVLAFPDHSAGSVDYDFVLRRLAAQALLRLSQGRLVDSWASEWRQFQQGCQAARADRKISLLCLEPATGRLVQRLNFTATGRQVAVQVGAGYIVVILGETAWGIRAS